MVFPVLNYLYALIVRMFRKVAWFLFFAVLAVSCLEDPDCYNLNNNVVGISFRKLFDGKADTVALIAVRSDDTDSMFYTQRYANGILFPLNYLQNQTTIYFDRPDGTTQQITLGYSAKSQFVSADCGERYVLSDLELFDNTFPAADFDSVRLLSPTLTKNPSTNIYIYRCPRNNFVKVGFRQLMMDTFSIGKPVATIVNGISADYAGLVFPADTLDAVKLPVNPASNMTTFSIDLPSGAKALPLSYTRYTSELFTKCGTTNLYGSLALVEPDPFVKILRDTLQDPAVTNVIIQRCPDTNLMKIVFKKSSATNANNDTVSIKKITLDYSAVPLYENTNQTTVSLPLNINANSTTFTFEFAGGVKTLTVNYTRTPVTYHSECGVSTVITAMTVANSDFTTPPPALKNADIKFPIVTNLEIVNQ